MGRKQRGDGGRDRNWYASRRRERSHDEAQALAEQRAAVPVPEHPLIPAGDPQLITTQDDLNALFAHVREVGSFAYDTEFIGELSYFPRLCLVQVATTERIALIDPLELPDLTELWKLIADPKIETIVHAGLQDLEPVVRFLDLPPANVFDTQLAAGFIGLGYPTGLAKLIYELLGVELGKGLTYTSWDRRPLSAVHLRYAADDVRYLPALKHAIDRRLETLGHIAWVAEECGAMCDRSQYGPDPASGFGRIRGASELSPRKQQILRSLLLWRDGAAREANVPPRTLIADQILGIIARQSADTMDKLASVHGLPRNVRDQYGQDMIAAIAQAMAAPLEPGVRNPRGEETATQRVAIDGLWAAVTSYCLGRGIDPVLAAGRQDVAAYYRASVTGAPVDNGKLSRGWRHAVVGTALTDFLSGKAELKLSWSNGALRADTSHHA